MDNHPVQLILKFSSILDGIILDSINTYKEVAGKLITFTIIKCDDISKIVMLQIFLVDI